MSISNRIKELRTQKKLSQFQFSRKLQVSQASISQYESGTRSPDNTFLTKTCETFDVNLNWLLTGKGSMFQEPEYMVLTDNEFLHLPVVAHIAAGLPIEVVEDEPLEWIDVPRTVLSLPPPYIVFKVDGDSMEPLILEGDYVIMSRDWRGEELHGKICGFRTDDGITLKKLMLQPKQKTAWLMPINHGKYEPKAYTKDTEDFYMFGVLVALIRKF
jgi:SOS-response transcriptional repressor LexA